MPGPKRRQAEIKQMLGLFTKFIAVERQALSALQAGDIVTFATLTGRAFVLNDRGNRVARSLGADRCAEDGTDSTELAKAQEKHRVVVAILYAPDANVDTLAIREARSGAADADAGFVAINVYDPREIAAVTVAYTLRSTPSVLVYERGEGAVNIFEGYVDEETVAQAVSNAVAVNPPIGGLKTAEAPWSAASRARATPAPRSAQHERTGARSSR